MSMKRSAVLLFFVFLSLRLAAAGIPSLDYGKGLAGLVGDGSFLVRTTPDGYECVRGGFFSGKSGQEALCVGSSFFPGGVEYIHSDGTRILYGAANGAVVAAVCGPSSPEGFESLGRNEYDELKRSLYKPYTEGLLISTPDNTLDKSVQFSQYLLDLGFNGRFMLCELFRWLDIWARDLGSGLMPGALATGRPSQARKSLDYDLARYARCLPSDCKNTNDPSQGGTAEGIGWTVRSIWNYYMYSGDKALLEKDMSVMRPWVDFWARRDYDEDGLIIDVTEFMDHMIMMLTTQGVSTLAANAMYSSMFLFSARIEEELGNTGGAEKWRSLYERTRDALNSVYWNEEEGYFNNMTLWGDVSRRSAQASQAMLLKIGATDRTRTRRTLQYLREHNWVDFGSLTITPKMNHVPLSNDQNVNVWPWWNYWEAEARLNNGDVDGGYWLLSQGASSINDEKYPGLMEENFDLSGKTFGGNAFPTAAGNMLEVVVKDLMGVKAVKAGWEEAMVSPNVPSSWKNYSCRVPVPDGFITLTVKNRRMKVVVESPVVKKVIVAAGVSVVGAEKVVSSENEAQEEACEYLPVRPKPVPPVPSGLAVQFFDSRVHQAPLASIPDKIDIEALSMIDVSRYTHLVIQGNILPRSARESIERFVRRGGQVIFFGATVNAKNDQDGAGILGEQCGIVDWVDFLPERKKTFIYDWEQKAVDYPRYSDYIYTAGVVVPSEYSGKDIYFEIGPLTGLDSVFVNGALVGTYSEMEKFRSQEYPAATDYPNSNEYMRLGRLYVIPASNQDFIHFGEANTVEIRIRRDVCKEGLTDRNAPNLGVMTGNRTWQYVDEDIPGFGFEFPKRKGVNYWGNEKFFNSWSTAQGLFGFSKNGQGVAFVDGTILEGIPYKSIQVDAVYTDFALFAPMNFEVLAVTTTSERLLYPMETERYPCAVRIVHNDNGGGYVLIAPALSKGVLGCNILKRLTK